CGGLTGRRPAGRILEEVEHVDVLRVHRRDPIAEVAEVDGPLAVWQLDGAAAALFPEFLVVAGLGGPSAGRVVLGYEADAASALVVGAETDGLARVDGPAADEHGAEAARLAVADA